METKIKEYIRTKDDCVIRKQNMIEAWGYSEEELETEMVSTSDNILDLMDAYVCINSEDRKDIYDSFENVKKAIAGVNKLTEKIDNEVFIKNAKKFKIYGAIWTEKGLKYVALYGDEGNWKCC